MIERLVSCCKVASCKVALAKLVSHVFSLLLRFSFVSLVSPVVKLWLIVSTVAKLVVRGTLGEPVKPGENLIIEGPCD